MKNSIFIIVIFLSIDINTFAQKDYNYYSTINKVEIYNENFSSADQGWYNYTNSKSTFLINNGLYLQNLTNKGSHPCYKSFAIKDDNKYEIELKFEFLEGLRNSGFFYKLSYTNQDFGFSISRDNKTRNIICTLGEWNNRKVVNANYNIRNGLNLLSVRNTQDSLHFYLNKYYLKSLPIQDNQILNLLSVFPYQQSKCKINNIAISVINKQFEFSSNDIENLKETKVAMLPIISSSLANDDIAKNIVDGLSNQILKYNRFNLIPQENINNLLFNQNINISMIDRYTAMTLGKMLGADAVLIGNIRDFSEDESYLGREETSYHEADKYQRTVNLSIKLNLISVYTGEVIMESEKESNHSDIGLKNIRTTDNSSLYNSDYSFGTNLILGVIEGVSRGISESKLDDKLLSFKELKQNCIEEIINFYYFQIISSQRLYSFKEGVKLNEQEDPQLLLTELTNNKEITPDFMNNKNVSSDIDVDIPKTRFSNPNAVAVIIGNKDYQQLPSVDYAINDCMSMKNYLIHSMGFKEGNILLLQNISKTDFEEVFGNHEYYKGRLYNVIKPNISDVFIYYSGHGAPGLENNKSYFVPIDCNSSYLEFRGYSQEIFYSNLAKLPAKSVTIILDACFSGENIYDNISSILPKVKNPVFMIQNGVLLTSSSATEPSCWYNDQEHGLFTYFFLKAIKDKENSDTNRDGNLTFQEIYNYISSQTTGIPYYARRLHSKEQHPTIQGNNEKILVNY